MSFISLTETTRKQVRGTLLLTAGFAVAILLGLLLWLGFGARFRITTGLDALEEPTTISETSAPAAARRQPLDPIPEDLQKLFAVNPDARMFVARYPTHHLKHDTIDLSGLKGCATVPHLYQWDTRWGYETYNENFFARAGCGPTCLSMADIFLTGSTDHDPLWMARFAEEHGYNEVGNGTKWALFSEGARLLGMRAEGITISQAYIAETLAQGIPIVCIMGPGDFTDQGHYLILTGIDADGNITLNDPNSRTRSERTWTFAELQPQIRGGWAIEKDNVD